ncbi:MAG: methyltransferase domain-containing protein [Bacteroidales bacterium]|nr:methyltransferase domain-containing protein [Bacteroidales bacterium]
MKLSPSVAEAYSKDNLPAAQAQRLARFIAFGPVVFQVSRLMLRFGILQILRENPEGLTTEEVASQCGIPVYAARVLMEASISIGTLKVEESTSRYRLSKTGWFLLTDQAANVDMDFNHYVNYQGMYRLEESLLEGRPAGLESFGNWETIYPGLSSLPDDARRSWFAFDHFYSDQSFDQALETVFSFRPGKILDVGGNTGKWARKCVEYDPGVTVTIADLPEQIALMKQETAGKPGAERISGYPVNVLEPDSEFPKGEHFDIIWMSQFLDCFSEEQILLILSKAAAIMDGGTRLCIMETFWDRQKFETAAMCLTLTSLYFSALANGCSRMYQATDMERLVRQSGLEIEEIRDNMGLGHSIMTIKKA